MIDHDEFLCFSKAESGRDGDQWRPWRRIIAVRFGGADRRTGPPTHSPLQGRLSGRPGCGDTFRDVT